MLLENVVVLFPLFINFLVPEQLFIFGLQLQIVCFELLYPRLDVFVLFCYFLYLLVLFVNSLRFQTQLSFEVFIRFSQLQLFVSGLLQQVNCFEIMFGFFLFVRVKGIVFGDFLHKLLVDFCFLFEFEGEMFFLVF